MSYSLTIPEGQSTHFQMAADGVWEEALCLDFPLSDADITDARTWIRQQSQDIAFEFFFEDENKDLFFFGVRIQSLTKPQQDALITDLLIESRDIQEFAMLETRVARRLGVDSIISPPPEFKEIGFEGFWRTRHPMVIWKRGDKMSVPFAEIPKHFFEQHDRPVMMEFAATIGGNKLPVWLALPISDRTETGYQLSYKRYNALADL